MNANNLQSLIARNAQAITLRESVIRHLSADAAEFGADGKEDEQKSTYKRIDSEKRKLAKLVALQNQLKTELKAVHGARKIEKLQALIRVHSGFVYHVDTGLTVAENLKKVKAAYDAFVPKKEDTRVHTEVVEKA